MTEATSVQRLKDEEEERKQKQLAKKRATTEQTSKPRKTAKQKKQTKPRNTKGKRKKKLIIESSSEDETGVPANDDVADEPDDDSPQRPSSTYEIANDNIETGNYYLWNIEDDLYAVVKVLNVLEDEDKVVLQFYKSESLSQNLLYKVWADPEKWDDPKTSLIKLVKPSFVKNKLQFKDGDIPKDYIIK